MLMAADSSRMIGIGLDWISIGYRVNVMCYVMCYVASITYYLLRQGVLILVLSRGLTIGSSGRGHCYAGVREV